MIFTVNKPLDGHDEDAPAYADGKMLVICDGLGGGGQNSYNIDGERRTSAYLGSRLLSSVCCDFLSREADSILDKTKPYETSVLELKQSITKALDDYVVEKGLTNIVKGKSMQMLPSTLACALYKVRDDRTEVFVISAGDSRVYALTHEYGLLQLSSDDVFDSVDAYDKAATMINNVRQGGIFHLNFAHYELPKSCVLFACSDGCFDYISTPMEFEYIIEYAICKADGLFQAENALGKAIGAVISESGIMDDCSLAGCVIGYSESDEMKNLFLKRARYVQTTYRQPFFHYDAESVSRRNRCGERLNGVISEIKLISLIDFNEGDEVYDKLCILNNEKKSLAEYLGEPEALKYGLWTAYKPTYERFRNPLTEGRV